jgi:CBS domain-containing protein
MRKLTAGDIMLRKVVTATPEDALAMARLKMMRLGVGGLPVVKEGNLVGIITHRDIILVGEKDTDLRVRDIMTSDVLTITRETPIREILLLMKSTGYQRLPVVEKKRLVGLVTQSNIIGAIADWVK